MNSGHKNTQYLEFLQRAQALRPYLPFDSAPPSTSLRVRPPSPPLTPMLLTTFAPWRAHQPSNAADDLVSHLHCEQLLPPGTTVMRHVPVSFELAPIRVIAKVVELRPAVVVCCGMAEGRSHLHLERYGKGEDRVLESSLPLERLLANTHLSGLSDDAGSYVCNHLYYHLLGAIARHGWPIQALFVHIPPLTPATQPLLARDLALILKRLKATAVGLNRT